MNDLPDFDDNPMKHPEEQPVISSQTPRFGRLLLVLVAAILVLAFITWASVAYVT